ncbi:MAG: tRNA pseudouridine(55) synthase TruB [Nitrospira sp.]
MNTAGTNINRCDSLDGVLIAYKETGWTSHDVVAKVRKLLGESKVGHAGTLDPGATGVLPVLVGRATRIAEYLVDWDKEYCAVLRLGETTDTQDASGQVLTTSDPSHVDGAAIRTAVAQFRGAQRQLPPMYSAVKVGGQPLYKAARAGKVLDRVERSVTIHELEVLAIHGRDVTLRIVCSKGTYVRTLCADIGQFLGVGGHLYALERSRVGPLQVDQALTIGQIEHHLMAGTLQNQVLSLDHLLSRLPAVVVDAEQAQRVVHGNPVFPAGMSQLPVSPHPLSVRLKNEAGQLLAIGTHDTRSVGPITIRKVFTVMTH